MSRTNMMEKKLYVSIIIIVLSAVLPIRTKCQETPNVTIAQQVYSVGYGDKVTINCSVEADPLHTIVYWNKNNSGEVRRLDTGLPGTNGMTVDNPSLMIRYATMRDNGIYTCCAVNDVGTGYSEDTMVIVNAGLPLVSVEPVNYNVLFGSFVIVHCTITAHPKANNVYWQRTKNGEISTLNTGTVGTDGITPADPSLKFNYTTTADEGMYVCFASNAIGTGLSREVNLTVYGDIPGVFIEHHRYSVDYGETVLMKCIITSTPDINEIYWEKYAYNTTTTLYAGHTGTFGNTISEPSLTIDKVTLEDNAMYRCCARNLVGTGVSAIIELIVKGGKPKTTVKSPFYRVVYGTSITLHCSVLCNPTTTLIYWEKNVTTFLTTINARAVGTDGITVDNPSLTFLFPTQSDSGSYNCFATNALGTSSSTSTFLSVIGGIPIVNMEMTTYITIYGRNITMRCNVLSTPKHFLVYWEKIRNGQSFLINAGMSGIHGVVPNNPSLTINYATLSDSGMYTCFAKNLVGIGRSSISSNLTVIGQVPKVSTKNSTYTAYVGIPVEMLCFVEAVPVNTNVYWKSNINDTVTVLIAGMVGFGGMTLDNPSLTVLNPTESMSGEYTCFSSNVIGTGGSFAIALIVRPLMLTDGYNETEQMENSTQINANNNEYSRANLLVVGLVTGFGFSFAVLLVLALIYAVHEDKCICWNFCKKYLNRRDW